MIPAPANEAECARCNCTAMNAPEDRPDTECRPGATVKAGSADMLECRCSDISFIPLVTAHIMPHCRSAGPPRAGPVPAPVAPVPLYIWAAHHHRLPA